MRLKLVLLLLLIFLFGFAIRAVEVLTNNYVFLFDQGRDYLAVKEIVFNRKLTLIGASTGLHGIFSGPLWYYLLAIPFILWRGDPYGGQVLMLVLGLITLVLVFWMSKKIFNKKIALIAFFLTAVSRPIMSQSTIIWNPNPATVLIVLCFYFFYQYFSTRKTVWLFVSFFLISLIYNFEVTVTIAFLFYSFLFLILIDRKTKIKAYLYSTGTLLLGFVPAVMFELRHQFLQTKTILNFFTGRGASLNSPGFSWLVQQDHLKAFWANFEGTFNHFLPNWGMAIFAILLILASVWLLQQKSFSKAQKKIFLYFCLFPLATFVFYVFYPNAVWQWYLTHLYFVYIMIAAVTGYFLVKRIKIFRPICFLILALMVFAGFKVLRSRYSHDFFDLRGGAGIKGKIQAIDYIYNDAQGEQFNVLVFTPPIYDYPFRYLLGWYGEKKYGYIPQDKKEGLVYLWIEPDLNKPWTYQGWLETVVGGGKILKEEELPSGFIISKRLFEP